MLSLASILLQGCDATSVGVRDADLGVNSDTKIMLASMEKPGVIKFEKHLAANWRVPLSGLLNLDHPKAINAGLHDRDEDIQLFVYTLEHPRFGTFLVDSGISESFVAPDENTDVSFIMKSVMNIAALDVVLTTSDLVKSKGGVDGVFLTHIHFDHILGLKDLSADVPVYLGSGDAKSTALEHIATRGTTNRLLEKSKFLNEWRYSEDGVIDVFGDGTFWAIHSPGHTPGTTAYLAQTTSGPQLIVGDVTHTRWGWDNSVEPGSYSKDTALNAVSLKNLRNLVKQNPKITAHPGHQK